MTSQVEASDNCTPENLLIVTQSPLPGTLVGTGTTTITLTVTDASLNFITCMTTFTVTESIPPTAVCQPYTAVLDATGNASITAANVDNGSSDNCGVIASRTVTPNTFTCANKGPNTVTLTVTDPSGNSASCLATVTVVDNTPPTITCPASFTQSTDLNLCSAVVSFSATASDNCPGVTYSCTPPSGSTFPKGPTTVNCTATDAGGLTSSACSFTVTVNDTQLPAIACPANIVVEPTCPDGAVVTYTAPVGTDNCPGALTIQTAGLASGSTFPIGVTTTNTFKVTDTSGNFVTCSFTVRVKTAAEVIQDLITRVLALPLTGQQSQGLVSKLQAALDAVNTGKTNVACNKLADFISQVTGFINNGTLTSAQGQPLIVSAAKVRNTLGCTNLGCT
ncbi:MAG: HYR domain-containing protein [Acidobacteriota bacterium]